MRSAVVAENRIFQALVDPSRRAIFVSLTRGEAAVKDLTARFDISQPAVSQHLATLKNAGLVKGRWRKWTRDSCRHDRTIAN
jgi:DNA-binding transcriptional ArsR family regulator